MPDSMPDAPTDTPPLILELKDLVGGYDPAAPVLRGVAFHLHPGQRVGLVGPNGAGKSTLLQTVMGLIPALSGTIALHGKTLETKDDFHEARLRTGFLFQHAEDQLFSPTVLDDVAFGPLNQGLSPDEARDRALETLAQTGLTDFADRVPYRLSGGEQKLVALATVLAMRPRLLLLDEPTTGLDAATKERITAILNGLDVASLVVSHELEFMAAVTDETYVLRDGRVSEGRVEVHRHVHAHDLGDVPHRHE